jgi:protocatechuate 3,4-dioxygenase beta subunit
MKTMSEILRKIRSGQIKFLIFFLLSLFLLSPTLFAKSIFAENSDMIAQSKKYSIGCTPTPPDALGPFYKPRAPLRNSVGKGYELNGKVLSSKDCAPIKEARIELWMAGPDGEYKDEYRATVLADESGEYGFESHLPPSYLRRPPHIHIRVTADGFNALSTQHYPAEGSSKAEFDLVLIPD